MTVIDDSRKEELYLIMEDVSKGSIQFDLKGEPPVYSVSEIRRIIRHVTAGLEFRKYRNANGIHTLTITSSSASLCVF